MKQNSTKKIIAIFTLCIVSIIGFTKVNAQSCMYGEPAPQLPRLGGWRRGHTANLTTSASSCLAKNTAVYFTDNYYWVLGVFEIEGILMEEDGPGNDDDPVKKYIGKNGNGYSAISWSMVEILDHGNLDSAGDQGCELYMKFRIYPPERIPFDMPQELFSYSICMN